METLPWELLGWGTLALFAPLLVEWSCEKWGGATALIGSLVFPILRWGSSVIPFCLAILTGGVLIHQIGFQPQKLTAWLGGALLGGTIVLAAHLLVKSLGIISTWPEPFVVFKDEPRWMLYRATFLVWADNLAVAAGAGFLIGMMELFLFRGVLSVLKPEFESTSGWILRVSVSSLVFLLTQNAFITVAISILYLLMQRELRIITASDDS